MTEYITLALAGIAAVLSLVCVLIRPKQGATLRDLQNLSQELQEEMRALRTEVGGTIHGTLQSTAELQANAQRQVAEAQNTRLRELSEQLAVRQTALQKAVTDQLQFIEQRMKTGALESEQKLENIRTTMETRIAAMQADNGKRLDEMRHTVDEKLQKTLDEKLQQSFSRVSEQLESVYKGLGEMQTLATGVGDLKKVLSNVKTRGILGDPAGRDSGADPCAGAVRRERGYREGQQRARGIRREAAGRRHLLCVSAHRRKISHRRIQRPAGRLRHRRCGAGGGGRQGSGAAHPPVCEGHPY